MYNNCICMELLCVCTCMCDELHVIVHVQHIMYMYTCTIRFILQNWTKLNKSGGGPWPEGRSHHAAVCLNYGQQYPQLLVTGGWDRQDKPLADLWILDIERGSWRKVRLEYTLASVPGLPRLPFYVRVLIVRWAANSEKWGRTHFSKLATHTQLKCARVKTVNGEGLEPRLTSLVARQTDLK